MAATVHFSDGCLSVADSRVFCKSRPRLAEALLRELQRLPDVAAARLDLSRGRCWIECRVGETPAQAASALFIAALQTALREEQGGDSRRGWLRRRSRPQAMRPVTPEQSPPREPILVRGPKRVLYLAAGAGSMVMTVVGVIVPGIPTVPFLLASSYYLARSSPRAHSLLKGLPLFGDMVREWDAHQAFSRSSKLNLAVFTLIIIVITVVFAQSSPLAIVAVAVVAPACLIGIIRLPEIEAGKAFLDSSLRRSIGPRYT